MSHGFWLGPVVAASPWLLSGCSPGMFGGSGGYGHGGSWHMMDYGFGGWFMWIGMLIVIGIVILALTRSGKLGGQGAGRAETALDILKKRYAAGEITREEFERMKNEIKE